MFDLQDVQWKNILDIKQLTIRSGVTTCILGESGSGKGSLLRLLAGMTSPDHGEIFYKGVPMSTLDLILHRREVVTAPQNPAIFEGTVRDNLQVGLLYTDQPKASESNLHKALENTELSVSLEQDAETLSGGEKQRLALARILLLKPPVLLMDEPTSSLDEATAERVLQSLVNEAANDQRSVVMISHSSALIQRFADDRIQIERGKVVQEGQVKR